MTEKLKILKRSRKALVHLLMIAGYTLLDKGDIKAYPKGLNGNVSSEKLYSCY